MNKLLALLLTFCVTYSFAQEQHPTEIVSIDKFTQIDEWQVYFENSELKIEYALHDCDATSGYDFQAVFLRYTNLTSETLELSWHLDLYYDGNCRTCGYGEYDRTMSLSPGEELQGTCANNTNLKLELFSKFIDAAYTKGAQLTSFQFSDLQISH